MNEYKVFYRFCNRVHEQKFRKQKSAYQFEQRCINNHDKPFSLYGYPITRMIKKEDCDNWEQYTVIGNQLVTVSELETILERLKREAQELQ